MFNNSILDEEAKLKVAEREHEAETYRLQTQLGYSSDRRAMKWIVGCATLIVILILMMVLI